MDKVSAERRSQIMSRIRSKDSLPEMTVRRFLHAKGLRYRLHVKELPGKPDLTFPGRRACVFVHGCFWHGCPRCIDGKREVKSNQPYWTAKVVGNRARDERNKVALEAAGWHVFVIWECEARDGPALDQLVLQLMALPHHQAKSRH